MKHRHLLKYPILILIASVTLLSTFWIMDWIIRVVIPLPQIEYGVTFSTDYAKKLGLNPENTFKTMLDELGVKNIRIPIYWDSVETREGKFDFQAYDRLLDLAQQKQTKVILAIGYKVPRWPECFPPAWSKDIPKDELKKQILNEVKANVEHFRTRPEVVAWQVENEPLLNFGVCKLFDKNFLKQEVNFVKSLDSRPVILTDSGELGFWVTAMQYSDIMGTSLYRIVWNPFFGYFRYPFPPIYYYFKGQITKSIFAPKSQGIFISELQAEPWAPGKSLENTSAEVQSKLFTLRSFKEIINFTANTRIRQQYFWGIEWWYFMKTKGYPEYWNFAKTLF